MLGQRMRELKLPISQYELQKSEHFLKSNFKDMVISEELLDA